MTWTKLGDEFPAEAAPLSDAGFRTHVEALAWSNLRLLDLHIPKRDLKRFAETADPEAAAKELVETGWWKDVGDRWWIGSKFPEWQRDRIQVEHRREQLAIAQRRSRRHKLGNHSLCLDSCKEKQASTVDSTDYSADESGRDPGRVGAGRAGTPSNSKSYLSSKISTDVDKKLPEQRESVDDDPWAEIPVAVPGSGLPDSVRGDRDVPTDRCPWCMEPVDPGKGSMHPKCRVEAADFEQSRTP